MFPRLADKSFVKQKPDKEPHVYSSFINETRRTVLINESASSILGLCDGMHSVEDIISILSDKYKEDSNVVRENVQEFLNPLIQLGDVKDNKVEFSDKIIVRGSSEVYYPDALCWEITDYCPLNCIHCYLPRKNSNVNSRYDIDNILKMIDVMGVYQVQLTGGEALTHPDLEYIVESLISRGIIITISTSGFNFNDDMFRYLVKLNKVQGSLLRVSLDGTKNTHNYIRRNEHAYDNAIEFIRTACSKGIHCQAVTTLMNQSEEELENLTILVKELGMDSIEFGVLIEQGNAKENEILSTWWSSKRYIDFLKELSSKYSSKTFTIRLPKELAEFENHGTEGKNCGAGHRLIRIKSNLDVTPCPMTEFNLGNLHEHTIFEIMSQHSNMFYNFRAPQKEFCSGCEKEDICNKCIAVGYSNKDNVKKCNWFNCVENCLKPFLD
jgi:Predicted Fe-S oxidoreductases